MLLPTALIAVTSALTCTDIGSRKQVVEAGVRSSYAIALPQIRICCDIGIASHTPLKP